MPSAQSPSQASPVSGGRYKLGRTYVINGVRYVPRKDPYYNRIGLASWYGAKHHGKQTANEEIFDVNRLTAAHKTLPLPSVVRVTNLDNGRHIVVRVNVCRTGTALVLVHPGSVTHRVMISYTLATTF